MTIIAVYYQLALEDTGERYNNESHSNGTYCNSQVKRHPYKR